MVIDFDNGFHFGNMEDPNNTTFAAFNQSALQKGADRMARLTYQDPAWLALQGLLAAQPSIGGGSGDHTATVADTTPAAVVPFAAGNVHDDALRPSPFESPLAVSSIGSPNSARDFGDSPLMRADDDYILGGDKANVYANIPLFDTFAASANVGADVELNGAANGHVNAALSHVTSPWAAAVDIARNTANGQPLLSMPEVSNGPFHPELYHPIVESTGNVAPRDIDSTAAKDSAFNGDTGYDVPFGLSHDQANFMSTIRRLSLSESVSGYSSGQESGLNSMSNSMMLGVSTNHSGAVTPSSTSSEGSPISSGALGNVAPETISQLAGIFVREYARCRDEQDTSVLIRALNVAGISVDAAAGSNDASPYEQQPESMGTASPFDIGANSPIVGISSRPTQVDGMQYANHSAYHPQLVPSAHEHGKVRSSIHTSAKKDLVGHSHAHAHRVSHSPEAQPEGYWVNGKRFFQCEVCNKTFDRAFNLKTHRAIHSNHREYPFTCPFANCGKAFSRKADCNRHTKSVHLKKGEKLQPGQSLAVVDLG